MPVSVLVALDAKSYEILGRIIAQSAPRLNVMDLKIFHAPTRLASPAVAIEDFPAKLAPSGGKPCVWTPGTFSPGTHRTNARLLRPVAPRRSR